MDNSIKGNVVFKHKAEDFIVEEIGSDGKLSNVSEDAKEVYCTRTYVSGLELKDKRPFVLCDLEKIDIDHFTALEIICNAIGIKPHKVGYSGTKDKCAWTCQRISLFDPDIDKINLFSHNGIRLKNFRWGKHKLRIGDLKGNRFKITLRDVDESALKILNRVRNTRTIPNLFGAQRFGSVRKDNFEIGRLILKKRYKEAIFTFLSGYGADEDDEVKEAKRRFKKEGNIKEARNYFPIGLKPEHRVIEHLSENKNDFIGALSLLGEKVLLIICQSVQSKIFNDVLLRAIDEDAISQDETLPIIGYDHSFSRGRLGRIEKDVLDGHELSIENFRSEIEGLSLRSSKRKAFFEVKDMRTEIYGDEVFEKAKKIVLSFTLDSGSYATSLLEYFFELR